MKLLSLSLILCLCGCSTVSAKKGAWTFSRTSIGTQLNIGSFEIIENGHGNIIVRVDGLQSDQVQAIKAAAEGAARGAIKP